MKKHSFTYEIFIFFLIILFFILPPFFVTQTVSDTFSTWSFPISQGLRFLFACMLYFLYIKIDGKKVLNKNDIFYKVIFPCTICFGSLLCISFMIKGISLLIPVFKNNEEIGLTGITEGFPSINRPETFVQILFCLLNFIFAAFYEEVIYRFYIPEFTLKLVNHIYKKTSRFDVLIIELIALLIFAFSHKYLGVLSVINAAFAHIALRFCYKKSENLYPVFAAHFFYNIISLYLL